MSVSTFKIVYMKRQSYTYSFFAGLFCLQMSIMAAAQTPNLAILVADSITTNTSARVLFIDGTPHSIPTDTIAINGSQGNDTFRFSASATSTMHLSNSDDGSKVLFNGVMTMDTTTNTNSVLIRGIGSIDVLRQLNVETTYTGSNGNQPRAATTIDNQQYFITDQGGIYTNNRTSNTYAGTYRNIKSFGGTVYVVMSSTSSSNIMVSTVSAPMGGVITGLNGLPNSNSIKDFHMVQSQANGPFDRLYTIHSTSNTNGQIAKYSLVNGTWVANGQYNTGCGGYGLVAIADTAGCDIYIITGGGAQSGNMVLRLKDSLGYNQNLSIQSQIDTIYQTPLNTSIKGIALSPQLVLQPQLFVSTLQLPTALSRVGTFTFVDSFQLYAEQLRGPIHIHTKNHTVFSTTRFGIYTDTLTLHPQAGKVDTITLYAKSMGVSNGYVLDSIHVQTLAVPKLSISTKSYHYESHSPTPLHIANTPFVFDHWDANEVAGTYPSHMIFHAQNGILNIGTDTPLTYNWTCPYNITTRSRIRGLNADGIAFINTGSAQFDDCQQGPSIQNTYVGAALVAINTSGMFDIDLQYTVALQKQSDGTVPRVSKLVLQYRLDSNGTYQNFAPVQEFSSFQKQDKDEELVQMSLPSILHNRPYVELRWLYYTQDGGSGSRPEIRLDDIRIGPKVNGIHDLYNNNIIYPNPVKAGAALYLAQPQSGEIWSALGQKMVSFTNTNTVHLPTLAEGIYYLVLPQQKPIKIVVVP
jgi:hypothetical protein